MKRVEINRDPLKF